jgi:NhaP-type Na+/H+ or K+/H+ antiporter
MGRFIFLTAVAVWLGTVVSFSYVSLPTIHGGSDGQAPDLLRRLFPRYYSTGIVCGLIALAAVSLAPATPGRPPPERSRLAFPVVVALACTLAAQQLLLPRLAAMQGKTQEARYARLHQFSAMLNSTVLAMLVLAVAAIATR